MSIQIISGIYSFAQSIGILESIKPALIQQPDPAAKYLGDVLDELFKTYSSIDKEISEYLGIWFDVNEKTGVKEQRKMLISLEGGAVNVRMAEARGHCSKIKTIHERYLDSYFNKILNPLEASQINGLFRSLYDWDTSLVHALDSLANWLQTNAQQVLDLVDKTDFHGANKKIEADRIEIRDDRVNLSKIMTTIRDLQSVIILVTKSL